MEDNGIKKDEFSGKIGFVLACVGSAVGMGNIWLFPYRLGQYGGSAFLIPFVIFMVILGNSGVVGEIAFGRAMRTGPVGAFKKALQIRNKKYGDYIGAIPLIGCLLIGIGYSVIVGWVIKFIFGSITGSIFSENSVEYFQKMTGGISGFMWHIAALIITFIVMFFGVSGGIERINRIVMPVFFVMFVCLAIFVVFIPNALDGYLYLFSPNLECLVDPKTWIAALGQAFFSLSLAGSGTIVYGSYLSEKEDVISSAKNICFFSFLASILAAIIIIPAVFAFGADSELNSGPPLIFITMPKIFKLIPAGQLIAFVFFVAILFVAITSLVNLFEAPIEFLQSNLGLSRGKAVAIIGAIVIGVGVLIEDAEIVGIWMDILSVCVIPLGACLAGIMFFWVCGKKFVHEQVELGRNKSVGKFFDFVTRYVFIGLILITYVIGILIER